MPDSHQDDSKLKFRLELNVLNHLGIGLYSSTPAVMTEIIANAWDADAKTVTINIDSKIDKIVIEDTGHGMDRDGVEKKFLSVGYSRRKDPNGNEHFSASGKRRVMGRKGIGKLAMFSLADKIEIVTKAKGKDAVAFHVDVSALKKTLEAKSPDDAEDFDIDTIPVPDDFNLTHGTRITLSNLNKSIDRTESFLRKRLARRFSIFSKDFKIDLNSTPIVRKDAGFYENLQFTWHFNDKIADELKGLIAGLDEASGLKEDKIPERRYVELKDEIKSIGRLEGFIATVDTPKSLGKGEESLNKISIFANGRVFQEDILPELGDTKYFNSYIIGEVHADFLDDDDVDRATASREAIKHDDGKFRALKLHLKERMNEIRDQWDDLRKELGYGKVPDKEEAVQKWLDTIEDPRDQKLADKLMVSIANHEFSNNTVENRSTKKLLYRSAIAAFEKLRVRKRLEELEGITDVMSPEFQAIFTSIDDIEESYFYDITAGRLEVIEKLEKHVNDEVLEKVVQEYLFDHLWLLDPSWGRISGSAVMEKTLTKHLKKACPDTKEGARLDITYRIEAGTHVVVELKKPGKSVPYNKLHEQANKYRKAVAQYYKDNNKDVPSIAICLLVHKKPTDMDATDENTLLGINTQLLTYNSLILGARMAYEQYIDAHNSVGSIEAVLKELS